MNNKSYHLVVFDWEGTLEDISGQFINTLTSEAARLQLGEVDEHAVRRYLGLGERVLVQKLFPHVSAIQHEKLLQALQHSFAFRPSPVYLMPGARNLLESMQRAGLALAIATNRGQQSLERALQMSGLEDFFPVTRCAGQVPAKPCPKMLEQIMETYDIAPEHTLMVGDSVIDIEMAQSIPVDAIGVDFYYQVEQQKELLALGALVVFNGYDQLADYLRLPD